MPTPEQNESFLLARYLASQEEPTEEEILLMESEVERLIDEEVERHE